MNSTNNDNGKSQLLTTLSSIFPDECSESDLSAYFDKKGWGAKEIVSGTAMGEKDFQFIVEVASNKGDHEIILCNYFSLPSDTVVLSVPFDYLEFKTALTNNSEFLEFDVVIFGGSGQWVGVLRGMVDGVLYYS
ncbi:MAG: hypothetical protein EG824_12210 [Deltaproteobacteria bacterium]|nr:hypothetical protein [Deltaproteobacteria bacterium]